MKKLVTEIFIFLILLKSQAYGLVRTDDHSSSLFNQKANARVKGHVIKTINAASFITCAQLCLLNSKCKSINFQTRGVCELNDKIPNESNVEKDHQVILGWWISIQTDTFTFTHLGARGQYGPTNSNGYNGSNLEGKVQVNNGIQTWTVPFTGNYIIEAYGASGANGTCTKLTCQGWSTGGHGAKITGTFTLKKGIQLKLLVGQQGLLSSLSSHDCPGGGGGGSFVVDSNNNTPLIIAGGGGGGGITVNGVLRDGDHGQTTSNGSRYGGSNGNGGLRFEKTKTQLSPQLPPYFSSAGAGFKTNGDSAGDKSAQSFLNGGVGGKGETQGGFGGGGFALALSPGGGGGYSGGGVVMDGGVGQAGGGGSINKGYDQLNQAGYNLGDGRIVIKLSQ